MLSWLTKDFRVLDKLWSQLESLSSALPLLMSGDGVPLIQMDKDDREYTKEELELHIDL